MIGCTIYKGRKIEIKAAFKKQVKPRVSYTYICIDKSKAQLY